MLRRAVALAALMTIGASGASLAAQALSRRLGARRRQDQDPCRILRRGGLRAQHMGQTRRLRRKGGRSPYSQGQAGRRRALVGERLRSAAQPELRDQRSCRRQAHDHAGMRDGRVRVSKHGLERRNRCSEIEPAASEFRATMLATMVGTVAISDAARSRNAWQSSSPIHEQQHPGSGERRHRDEIGGLKGDVLPEQNARQERASNRQFLNIQHRIGDELEILRV